MCDADRRFLRARNYVPCAAFKQYAATVVWRQQLGLDAMYTNADVSHFEAMRRLVCDLNFLSTSFDYSLLPPIAPSMDRPSQPYRSPHLRLPRLLNPTMRSRLHCEKRSEPINRLPDRRIR